MAAAGPSGHPSQRYDELQEEVGMYDSGAAPPAAYASGPSNGGPAMRGDELEYSSSEMSGDEMPYGGMQEEAWAAPPPPAPAVSIGAPRRLTDKEKLQIKSTQLAKKARKAGLHKTMDPKAMAQVLGNLKLVRLHTHVEFVPANVAAARAPGAPMADKANDTTSYTLSKAALMSATGNMSGYGILVALDVTEAHTTTPFPAGIKIRGTKKHEHLVHDGSSGINYDLIVHPGAPIREPITIQSGTMDIFNKQFVEHGKVSRDVLDAYATVDGKAVKLNIKSPVYAYWEKIDRPQHKVLLDEINGYKYVSVKNEDYRAIREKYLASSNIDSIAVDLPKAFGYNVSAVGNSSMIDCTRSDTLAGKTPAQAIAEKHSVFVSYDLYVIEAGK